MESSIETGVQYIEQEVEDSSNKIYFAGIKNGVKPPSAIKKSQTMKIKQN